MWSKGLIKPLPLELWIQQNYRHSIVGVKGWHGESSFVSTPAHAFGVSAMHCGVESLLSGCTAIMDHVLVRHMDDLASVVRAAVGRFDRSRGRSIESIGSVGSVILQIFRFFCHVGELEICLVSKFQLCTTLGGRKNLFGVKQSKVANRPKRVSPKFRGDPSTEPTEPIDSIERSCDRSYRPKAAVLYHCDRNL